MSRIGHFDFLKNPKAPRHGIHPSTSSQTFPFIHTFLNIFELHIWFNLLPKT